MKTCNGPCKQVKDDSDFYIKRYKNGRIGLRAYCKTCSKQERDAWRKSSPKDNERNKEYNRRNADVIRWKKLMKYWPGLTWEQTRDAYTALLDRQNHCCALCRKKDTNQKNLAVDHNHDTNVVRGLLCNKCNRGLGFLQEERQILEESLIYLNNGA